MAAKRGQQARPAPDVIIDRLEAATEKAKAATREAHEAIQALRELQRDGTLAMERATENFKRARLTATRDFDRLLTEAFTTKLQIQLSAELSELAEFVIRARKDFEEHFSTVTAAWLVTALNELQSEMKQRGIPPIRFGNIQP
jgi:hypothetical protein